MDCRIDNARVLTENGLVSGAVRVREGKIVETRPCLSGENELVVDAEGKILSPGFIDLHVHGGGGACVMSGKALDVVRMCDAHAQFGTTTILPTTWTAPAEKIERAIDAVRTAREMACDATIAGVHLEGPYLSPGQAGAQSPESLLIPARHPWGRFTGRWDGVVMVGVAPELPGAMEMAEELARHGIVPSIAHSDADQSVMDEAVLHGFSDVTHLYSGCSTFCRRGGFRVPGVVESALVSDALTVQVIGDGCHLPHAMLQLIYRCKGVGNMYWITDGLDYAAAELEPGMDYRLQNGMRVVYEDGVMKLESRQAFAGSVGTMDRMVRMGVAAGIPVVDALRMASETPARRLGLEKTKGKIAVGYDADLVLLDDSLNVRWCMAKGKIIRDDLEGENER